MKLLEAYPESRQRIGTRLEKLYDEKALSRSGFAALPMDDSYVLPDYSFEASGEYSAEVACEDSLSEMRRIARGSA